MHDQHGGAGQPARILPPPPSTDPYLDALTPDSRAAYRVASPDANLSDEIRLLRAVLSSLAEDLPGNHKSITACVGVLVRALTFQARQSGGDASFAAGPTSSREAGRP